jgi:hypothetical protein
MAMATAQTLAQLAAACRNYILNNQLLTAQRKRTLRAWVARVENDAGSADMDRRLTLASFLLSGLAEDSD